MSIPFILIVSALKKLASGSDDLDVISADLIPDSEKTVGAKFSPHTISDLGLGRQYS